MEIELTSEQDALIRQAIEKGLYQNPADAVHFAMDLWVEQERARLALLEAIQEGEDSAEREGWIELDSDEAITALIEDVKQQGRDQLAKAG
jgi:putative addiction module CopG family antidote